MKNKLFLTLTLLLGLTPSFTLPTGKKVEEIFNKFNLTSNKKFLLTLITASTTFGLKAGLNTNSDKLTTIICNHDEIVNQVKPEVNKKQDVKYKWNPAKNNNSKTSSQDEFDVNENFTEEA